MQLEELDFSSVAFLMDCCCSQFINIHQRKVGFIRVLAGLQRVC